MRQSESEILRTEYLAIRAELLGMKTSLLLLRCCLLVAKANFNPDQPRVPRGSGEESGRWTNEEGGPSDQRPYLLAINDPTTPPKWPRLKLPERPGIGHNGGPPLEDPPEIPFEEPTLRVSRTRVAKRVAEWLLRAIVVIAEPELLPFVMAVEAAQWAWEYFPRIQSFLDEPRTLDELRRLVNEPALGYEIHHIVERASALRDGFPLSLVDGPDNLVRIPKWKHEDITGWFARKNSDYDGLSPREYLSGRRWEERVQVGLFQLRDKRVMKP